MIRVLVYGAHGRMGRLACEAIEKSGDLALVGRAGRGDPLARLIGESGAEVVVDFTLPAVALDHALTIVAAGAAPVIGTSGLDGAALQQLAAACTAARRGAIVAPNFAIGAVLMMRFAELAARHLRHAEIVEAHHAGKVDAPSGTAAATAARMAAARAAAGVAPGAVAGGGPARGETRDAIAIHSIRLPGVVAEQSVLLGEVGQKLEIRHVAYSREAYMPGVLLACRKVGALDRLVVGLDALLFPA